MNPSTPAASCLVDGRVRTIVPRSTRLWLRTLQIAHARYCQRCPAIPLEAAADEGTALAQAFLTALEDGDLIEMEPNVIVREMDAGFEPEEFRDGSVFHVSLKQLTAGRD